MKGLVTVLTPVTNFNKFCKRRSGRQLKERKFIGKETNHDELFIITKKVHILWVDLHWLRLISRHMTDYRKVNSGNSNKYTLRKYILQKGILWFKIEVRYGLIHINF